MGAEAMTVKSQERPDDRSAGPGVCESFSRCDGFAALTKADIAELNASAINRMSCAELVHVIRVADLPGWLGLNLYEHLPFYDHTVLARLAHLARRCCRRYGTASFEQETE